jgi:hypothetical protein
MYGRFWYSVFQLQRFHQANEPVHLGTAGYGGSCACVLALGIRLLERLLVSRRPKMPDRLLEFTSQV